MKAKLAFLLVGVLLGLGAAQLAPRFWHRLTPGVLRGLPTVGTVDAKQWDEKRLLLTVITDRGAVLASFTRKTEEIDLLVEAGDTVELGLARYRPFVEDPIIERVVKAGARGALETGPAEEPLDSPPSATAMPATPQVAAPALAEELLPDAQPEPPADPSDAGTEPGAAAPPAG